MVAHNSGLAALGGSTCGEKPRKGLITRQEIQVRVEEEDDRLVLGPTRREGRVRYAMGVSDRDLRDLEEGKKINDPVICPKQFPRDSPEDGGDSGRNTTHDTPGQQGAGLVICRRKVHSQRFSLEWTQTKSHMSAESSEKPRYKSRGRKQNLT